LRSQSFTANARDQQATETLCPRKGQSQHVLNTLPRADLRQIAASAKASEAAGYDTLLTMENKHDPFLAHAIAEVSGDRTCERWRRRFSAQPD
jgi:hypothetical protein